MSKYALIETDTLTDTGKRYDITGTPPDLSHKSPPLKMVPVVVSPNPPFDPATEKLVRAADVVTLTELTESRQVVALSAEELDELARRGKLQAVGTSIATLRTWAADAQGTTVTSGNAVATLQVVVNRLGTFFDRFADLIEGQYIDQ